MPWQRFSPDLQRLALKHPPIARIHSTWQCPRICFEFRSTIARGNVETALHGLKRFLRGARGPRLFVPKCSTKWAASDPGSAARYAAALPEGPSRSDLLGRTISRWADQDNESALRWARELPHGNEREHRRATNSPRHQRWHPSGRCHPVARPDRKFKNKNGGRRCRRQAWDRSDASAAAAWVGSFRMQRASSGSLSESPGMGYFEDPQSPRAVAWDFAVRHNAAIRPLPPS